MLEVGKIERREVVLAHKQALDARLASQIGLDIPKDFFDRVPVPQVEEIRRIMSEKLKPHIDWLWKRDPKINFVVVSGRDVYSSYDNIEDLSQAALNRSLPNLPIEIARTDIECPHCVGSPAALAIECSARDDSAIDSPFGMRYTADRIPESAAARS